MKTTFYLFLTFLCLSYGCNSDESISASELESKIDSLKSDINGIIAVSTGETSKDCRTADASGGDGCGPIYVYGVLGIDTLKLKKLIDELSSTQTILFNLEGGPVCDLGIPSKDSLINGVCKGCYGLAGNNDCF